MSKRWLSVLLVMMLVSSWGTASAARAYLIPDSDTRYLTEEELWGWDYEALGYILNEIFARHGYTFIPGRQYYNYFNAMPWYTPNVNDDDHKKCYAKMSKVEWANEGLVKDVRADMRALGTKNPAGQSIRGLTERTTGILSGFAVKSFAKNQTMAIYSGPGGEYYRGANGKAACNTNGNVFVAGWENGWLLIMYETNKGGVRVGYASGDSFRDNIDAPRLSFDYTQSQVRKNCSLTDDPAATYTSIRSLRSGDTVTYLTSYLNDTEWAYVETSVDGVPVRGFVPADCLDLSLVENENG